MENTLGKMGAWPGDTGKQGGDTGYSVYASGVSITLSRSDGGRGYEFFLFLESAHYRLQDFGDDTCLVILLPI